MAGRPEIWEHCCINIGGKGLKGSFGVQLPKKFYNNQAL